MIASSGGGDDRGEMGGSGGAVLAPPQRSHDTQQPRRPAFLAGAEPGREAHADRRPRRRGHDLRLQHESAAMGRPGDGAAHRFAVLAREHREQGADGQDLGGFETQELARPPVHQDRSRGQHAGPGADRDRLGGELQQDRAVPRRGCCGPAGPGRFVLRQSASSWYVAARTSGCELRARCAGPKPSAGTRT